MNGPIRLDFSDTLTPALDRAIAANHDFTPAMRSIAALMEEATQYRFEQQAGPDGVPWTQSERAKRDGGKTLIDTARLLGSIVSAFTAMTAEAGTNVIYALIQHFGGIIRGKTRPDRTTAPLRTPFGPRASVTIPAHPFLGFSAEDRTGIEVILTRHLGDAFAGATVQ